MRPWPTAAGAAGLGLVVALALRLPFLGDLTVSLASDLGQLFAATAASAACAVAARRTSDRRRQTWVWSSIGTGCWAAGQAVWSWYELVLDQEVPFPSLADVGFLLFPVGMAIGLLIWLGSQGDQLVARGRDLLDGSIIATSLLAVSWVTALGSVVSAGADALLPLVLSLAYPVGDVILATLVLMALARGRPGERSTLVVLGLGLGGLAFADSAYVYLLQIGSYSSADVASSGWVLGFLLVAAAAASSNPATVEAPARRTALAESSPLQLGLPYLPLVAAGVVLVVTMLRSSQPSDINLLFGVALVLLMLTRQFLGMLDNHRLLQALGGARDQLQHQASHDSLTGLANRSLFADRLHQALKRPTADISVLFCDLDDFKLVNDRWGHEMGDELLVVVGQRLLQCVRSADTVARLGGDEFAILVESGHAVSVAERVVELLAKPVELRGQVVSTSASVGIAHHHVTGSVAPVPSAKAERETGASVRPDARRAVRPVPASELGAWAEQEALATLLLREADAAMYAAKGAGKSRAVLSELPSVPEIASVASVASA